jgi:hypothetical protein
LSCVAFCVFFIGNSSAFVRPVLPSTPDELGRTARVAHSSEFVNKSNGNFNRNPENLFRL